MRPHTSTSGHPSGRSWLTGLAESLLDPLSVLLGAPLHLLDLRPRLRRMDLVLKHVSNNFKPRLGQLVNQRFEFVTSRHGGERIPCLSLMIKNITTTKNIRDREISNRNPGPRQRDSVARMAGSTSGSSPSVSFNS